jgi:hypothetical protein
MLSVCAELTVESMPPVTVNPRPSGLAGNAINSLGYRLKCSRIKDTYGKSWRKKGFNNGKSYDVLNHANANPYE